MFPRGRFHQHLRPILAHKKNENLFWPMAFGKRGTDLANSPLINLSIFSSQIVTNFSLSLRQNVGEIEERKSLVCGLNFLGSKSRFKTNFFHNCVIVKKNVACLFSINPKYYEIIRFA